MGLQDLAKKLALLYSNIVLSEIPVPGLDDPDKYRYGKRVVPLALRYIDLDSWRPLKPVNERSYWFAYIGRLEPEKGFHVYIRALEILARKGLHPPAAAAGSGLLEPLARAAAEKGLITYMGLLGHGDVKALLNETRFLVLPSSYEGVPTIIAEAMATGTPVIATRVGGIPFFVREGETGFLVDNSPESLAAAMEAAMRLSVEKLGEISFNCRALAEKYLSLEKAVARYRVIARIIDDG